MERRQKSPRKACRKRRKPVKRSPAAVAPLPAPAPSSPAPPALASAPLTTPAAIPTPTRTPTPEPGSLPTVPDGWTLVDLIDDGGFESSVGGFDPDHPEQGAVAQTATAPITGASSLALTVNAYGRVAFGTDYGYESGPFAESVTAKAKARVDAASLPDRQVEICSIAYLEGSNEPLARCSSHPVEAQNVAEVFLELDTDGQQLDRVFFRFMLDDSGSIDATIDDAHLYVVVPQP